MNLQGAFVGFPGLNEIYRLVSSLSDLPKACLPGDFVTKVNQINSQSDLISMLSFAGPSYLTFRFSVYMILI